MPAPTGSAAAWDAHWRSGALSSLSSGDASVEAPEAVAAWNRFFKKLPKGAKILDLATGNGIVAAHANAFSKEFGAGFAVTGVDQAAIDPLNTVTEGRERLEGVTFMGAVAAEDLPFADGAFDAVTGQYAIEYTDPPRTAAEAARVVRRGGRFRFVCHARAGAIVAFNAPKAKQCAWLLAGSGVFEALEGAARDAFLEAPGREESRARLRTVAVAARAELARMGANPELETLLANLVQAYIGRAAFKDFESFRTWLAGVRAEVAGQVGMIEALIDAALDFDAVDALSGVLAEAGFGDITIGELLVGPKKQLAAWQIEGIRA